MPTFQKAELSFSALSEPVLLNPCVCLWPRARVTLDSGRASGILAGGAAGHRDRGALRILVDRDGNFGEGGAHVLG